jgi:hypothetical protein
MTAIIFDFSCKQLREYSRRKMGRLEYYVRKNFCRNVVSLSDFFWRKVCIVKFRYLSKKASKVWKNLPLFWYYILNTFKKCGRFFSHFVAFSQYLNFGFAYFFMTLRSVFTFQLLLFTGLAPRPGPSHLVQSGSIGVNRWRKAGKVPWLFASWSLCQPLPY